MPEFQTASPLASCLFFGIKNQRLCEKLSGCLNEKRKDGPKRIIHSLFGNFFNYSKTKGGFMTSTMQKRNGSNSNEPGSVVDNIFNNTLRRFFDGNLWDIDGSINTGNVPVNVRETDHQYEVDVIAPGCHKENFKVQVEKNVLQISLNLDEPKRPTEEKAGWVRNEYIQRSFSRHFTLDETVDTAKISAEYTDGILRIILPKNEKAKTRLLTIEVR